MNHATNDPEEDVFTPEPEYVIPYLIVNSPIFSVDDPSVK